MKRWAVRWYEGMPLTPQHLQAADRFLMRQVDEAEDWIRPFSWGVRRLTLAVNHEEVTLAACEARFKDGTKFSIPEDAEANALRAPLGEVLRAPGATATIYLAIPAGPEDRYEFATRLCEDDDADSGEPIAVEFRRPRIELLAAEGTTPPVGSITLAIGRVGRSARPGGPPELLESYIPPLLLVDASGPLVERLRRLAGMLHARVGAIGDRFRGEATTLDARDPADTLRFLKLMAFGAVDAHLRAVIATQGLTPWAVFLELCRAAGQVAPFRPERLVDDVPEYRHEDIAGCFDAVIRLIEAPLAEEELPPFVAHPFRQKPGLLLDVPVESAWFRDRDFPIYLGVSTTLDAASCESLLSRMDLAIASRREVDAQLMGKTRGLVWTRTERPPPGMPAGRGLVFLRHDPDDEQEVIPDIIASRSLAIKFNREEAEFRDGDVVTAINQGEKHDLKFALYVPRNAR